jgi:cellulose synthase (UDP-forming)
MSEEADGIQQSANRIERQVKSPSVTLILFLSSIGAFVYLGYLIQPEFRGDLLPYTLVLIAEIFIIFQGLMAFWTILSGRSNPRSYEYHDAQNKLFTPVGGSKSAVKELDRKSARMARVAPLELHRKPITIDVFIPVYGEPIEEIRETAIAARDMYGLHKTFILDDGKSDDVMHLAKKINVGYVRRPTNQNAKAGNLNYALDRTNGDFFLILDADFVAEPDFLYETLPFFEDPQLAFVQTPQYYTNQTNFVSNGASFMQHVFYSLIQSGKNRFNSSFCVGTNVVFRRSAIESIGGIYDKSKSEDIWSSLLLHEKGFRSVYIPTLLAVGKTPDTLMAYSKQQLRWATGSFEIFLRRNPLFIKRLSVDQRLQYLTTTSYYFIGFSVLLLLLLPPLQIFFNLSPISTEIPIWQWALMYSGFYLTQLVLAFYTMGGLKLRTLVLANASFPIYIKAFFNALFRRNQTWKATNSMTEYDSPFNYIRFQVYVFVFLLLTSVVGVAKALYTYELSISLVWNIVNTLFFGYFVGAALVEAHKLKRHKFVTNRQPVTDKLSDAAISEGGVS